MVDVAAFYDEHPINEREILAKLRESGADLDALRPEQLYPFDQDHYGGLEATDELVDAVGLAYASPEQRVLDICAGMGGTSRYLARRYGCRVLGVDLTQSRIEGARRLTRMVGLAGQVTFEQGDAARLEADEQGFDFALAQEAFLHIEDKEGLLSGSFRALRPGGRLGFTDWTAGLGLTLAHRERLASDFAANRIVPVGDYRALLQSAGFTDVDAQDLSVSWREILHARLEMFRSLEAQTVKQFGQARHDAYMAGYEFFVKRIDEGSLGGARLLATRPA